MEGGTQLFILRGDLPFPLLAEQFIAQLPRVRRFLEAHPQPFIAKIKRETFPRGKGSFIVKVQMCLSLEVWKKRSS